MHALQAILRSDDGDIVEIQFEKICGEIEIGKSVASVERLLKTQEGCCI